MDRVTILTHRWKQRTASLFEEKDMKLCKAKWRSFFVNAYCLSLRDHDDHSLSSWSTSQHLTMLVSPQSLESLEAIFTCYFSGSDRNQKKTSPATFRSPDISKRLYAAIKCNSFTFSFITPVQLAKMSLGMFNEEDKYNDIDETDNGFPCPALKIVLNMMGAV